MLFTPRKLRKDFIASALLVTTALFTFTSLGAQASLGDKSTEIVRRLQLNGVTKIGDMPLIKLEREIKKVKWFPLNGRPPLDISGNRQSAYYVVESGEVHESMQLPVDLESYRPQLELHEALGAIGLPDQQYQFTSALSLIDGLGASIDRQPVINEFGKNLFKYQKMAAMGGSSVGGGGDINGLAVKTMVLEAIRSSGERVNIQFFNDFPSVVFEPFYDPEHQFVWIQYFYRASSLVKYAGPLVGAVEKDGYQELMKLHFPAVTWEREPAKRKAIVEQLKQFVLSLYPSTNTYTQSRMVPSTCDPTHPIAFPVPPSPGIAAIQYLRLSAITKCERGDRTFGEGDWSMRAPGGEWLSKRWE